MHLIGRIGHACLNHTGDLLTSVGFELENLIDDRLAFSDPGFFENPGECIDRLAVEKEMFAGSLTAVGFFSEFLEPG